VAAVVFAVLYVVVIARQVPVSGGGNWRTTTFGSAICLRGVKHARCAQHTIGDDGAAQTHHRSHDENRTRRPEGHRCTASHDEQASEESAGRALYASQAAPVACRVIRLRGRFGHRRADRGRRIAARRVQASFRQRLRRALLIRLELRLLPFHRYPHAAANVA